MEKCSACGAPIENGSCSYCGTNYQKQDQPGSNQGQQQRGYAVPIIQKEEPYQMTEQAPVYTGAKNKMVALLLCIFLGYLGAHKFYQGKIGMGILYFFTIGLFGIGWLVDIVWIVLDRATDSNGIPLQ